MQGTVQLPFHVRKQWHANCTRVHMPQAREQQTQEGSAMKESLTGKRIAFLATNGVEQSELTEPWKALRNAGAELDLVSLETGEIRAVRHLTPGDTFAVDTLASEADVSDYDGLVLPGGVVNPDTLRLDESAVAFVRAFFERSKPVAAI